MSGLVVIAYETEEKAAEVRQRVLAMQTQYLFSLEDAVIAVKRDDGTVRLEQMFSPTAAGAATGSMWGLVVGLIFFMPLIGAAAGAASGALAGALSDYGVNDRFAKDVSASLKPGNAALFVLIRKMTTDKVLEDLKGTGGTVMRTSLDHAKETALRDAIDAHVAATGEKAA
jgi:uncharacterized membrane protein